MSYSPSQKFLEHLSVLEDLRLEVPCGRKPRAYYANADRTKARAQYWMNGKRVTVYGDVVGDKLVPRQS